MRTTNATAAGKSPQSKVRTISSPVRSHPGSSASRVAAASSSSRARTPPRLAASMPVLYATAGSADDDVGRDDLRDRQPGPARRTLRHDEHATGERHRRHRDAGHLDADDARRRARRAGSDTRSPVLCTMPSSANTRPWVSTGARALQQRAHRRDQHRGDDTPEEQTDERDRDDVGRPRTARRRRAEPIAAAHTTDHRTSRSPRRATTMPVSTRPTPNVDCNIANSVGRSVQHLTDVDRLDHDERAPDQVHAPGERRTAGAATAGPRTTRSPSRTSATTPADGAASTARGAGPMRNGSSTSDADEIGGRVHHERTLDAQ